jgi:chromate transporter
VVIAALAFVAIFFFEVAFPLVVLGAAALGLIGDRLAPQAFAPPPPSKVAGAHDTVIDRMSAAGELAHTRPSRAGALRVLVVCGLLWGLPLVLLRQQLGAQSVFVQEGVFFSRAAVVTFGGAYAVLAYIAQEAVDTFHWLKPGEMLDGLGLAETTPGPLILVVQFVGFMGAFRHPGGLPPMVAGTLGALITVWVTFVPCFLWIFLGAPYIEALRGSRSLRAALTAITAAVVGVILNLSLWFGLHVVFKHTDELHFGRLRVLVPALDSADLAASVFGNPNLKRNIANMARAASAALGLLWKLATGTD